MASLIVTVIAASLLGYTSHKLTKMARLRGWEPGCPERTMIVGEAVRRFPNGGRVIALSDPAHPGTRPYEMQVTLEWFGELRIGSETRVRCVDEDRQCYGPAS